MTIQHDLPLEALKRIKTSSVNPKRSLGVNYENVYSAKSPPLQTNKDVVWDEIGRELQTLEKIIHAPTRA